MTGTVDWNSTKTRDFLEVGFDAGSFPVGLEDGVDGAGKRHVNHEMIVNAVT
jgi:hypothetical protein